MTAILNLAIHILEFQKTVIGQSQAQRLRRAELGTSKPLFT